MRCRLALLILGLLAANADAKPLERVPEDGSLLQALQNVSPGGTIDVAGGVYPAPANSFRARNQSVTIRARGGAEVVLDGQGATAIFLVEDQGAAGGRTVAFEGITFRNGLSTNTRRGGAVTVDAAYATFTSCVFEDNAAQGTQARGGAVQVLGGGVARFVNSRFADNTSGLWGAGIFALEGSTVQVLWSEFTGNRTDLPGQGPVPAGAAIYVQDSTARVTGSRFAGNRSGWLGGALYAIGTFQSPSSVPSALLEVESSTFVGNRALANPCCAVPGPPTGGAIHVEDQATVVVRDSRFLENETNWGGAISSYRAKIDVHDSVFRGNRALPFRGLLGAGGTFNVTSGDFSGPDHPVAELHVADSLVQGRFGGTTEATAQHGGCIFAGGDLDNFNGNNAAVHRAIVELTNVALVDCDAETATEARALGGGIHTNLADLTLDHSLIVDSDALGDAAAGGAMILLGQSALHVSDSAFAHNTSVERGGAVRMAGGVVAIRDSLFLDNDATADDRIPGTVLTFAPDDELGITGVVENSIFSDNAGVAIFEFDNVGGPPFNEVVYNGNAFFSTPGKEIFRNQAAGFVDHTVAGLNALTIPRPGAPAFSKSDVNNTQLGAAPRVGRLVAGPSRVLANATVDADALASAFLGYAWTGGATAAISGGPALPGRTGVAEVDEDGRYRLRVGGDEVDQADVGAGGCSTEAVHCLNAERFLVEVYWRDFNGNVGEGSAVLDSGSDDSGLFWFFSDDNWEMLVKVLSGCRINQRYWVFAAATTNVEYTLRVTDKLTGATKSYFNPLGNAAVAITDTDALDVCDADPATTPRPAELSVGPAPTVVLDDVRKGACAAGATEMCLNGGRFRLEVDWRDFNGNRGSAQVVPFGSDDSGIFFFFTEDNWEMLVKVLTGCRINQRYWVFAAATTNVEYTLRVVDTETGATKSYFNPLGRAAAAVTDTEAFATCR